MSRNAISDNPEHYIFNIFRESMPLDPLEGLKQFFLAAACLKIFFRIDSHPPFPLPPYPLPPTPLPLPKKILHRNLVAELYSSSSFHFSSGISLCGELFSSCLFNSPSSVSPCGKLFSSCSFNSQSGVRPCGEFFFEPFI